MKNNKTPIDSIPPLVNDIGGWMTEAEGRLLYDQAKKAPRGGAIVEIGSFQGKSTIWMAKGSEAGNKLRVYAIDPHEDKPENFDKFRSFIARAEVESLVTPIRKFSQEAAKDFQEPVSMIFIDGAHEYEPVKNDFELWFPKVVENGIMAFHDTIDNQCGSTRVVRQFIYRSRSFREIGLVDSITYGSKVNGNSRFDRLRNRYLLLINYFCGIGLRLSLPAPVKRVGKQLMRMGQHG